MKANIFSSIKLTLLCLVFFSGLYTLIVYGAATLAPGQGEGRTITYQNKKYYTNVGQHFTSEQYFWSRPSAVDYNAAGSGGSNKGPSNPGYLETVAARIDTFLKYNPGIDRSEIPADLVTASGSGLDPHISEQAAKVQIKRIAHARGIAEDDVRKVVDNVLERPWFGKGHLNVLKANIALDQIK